jgi:hypothetical protein
MNTRKVRLVAVGSVGFFFSLLIACLIQHPVRAGTVVVVPHAPVVHTVPSRLNIHPHGSRATTSAFWWWP